MNYLKFMFQVIDMCNLACKYCSSNLPYIEQQTHQKLNHNELILFIEYVKKYIPKDFHIQYIITGGEPSLHGEISQILQILQKDTHSHDIRLRTNSYIYFDNIFSKISNIYFDITYHYDSVQENQRKDYFNIILHNVKFIIKNNNFCSLNIISFDDLSKSIINDLILQYKTVYGSNNAPYEIRTARRTQYYTPINNTYTNSYFNKNIYVYRVVKIMNDYRFIYGCDIANKYAILPKNIEYSNIRYKCVWRTIQSNLFKQEKCILPDCTCHICTLDKII